MDEPGPSNHSSLLEDTSIEMQLMEAQACIARMKQEKIQLETDFEFKRSRIKELYFAKETTIREQNAKLFEASKQISEQQQQFELLKEESENIKMIASVSENTKQEAVEELNKHHLQEIESLRCVLQDSMEEQRVDLLRQFEQERRRWEDERSRIERERDDAVAGSMKREDDEQDMEDQELEASMMKAQEEAEKLKSVVLPLEKEIKDLKSKLVEMEERLRQFQNAEKDSKPKRRLEKSYSDAGMRRNSLFEFNLFEKESSQDAEKVSLNELEEYVEVVNSQRLVLQQENEVLKQEMHEMCRLLENEQSKHKATKKDLTAVNHQLNEYKSIVLVGECGVFPKTSTIHEEPQYVNINIGVTEADNIASDNLQHVAAALENCELTEQDTPSSQHAMVGKPASMLHEVIEHDTISMSSTSSTPGATLSIVDDTSCNRVNSAPQLNLIGRESKPLNESNTVVDWTELPSQTSRKASKVSVNLFEEEPSPEQQKVIDDQHRMLRVQDKKIKHLEVECEELREKITMLTKQRDNAIKLRFDLEESVKSSSEEARKKILTLFVKIENLERMMEENKTWQKSKETEDDKRLTNLMRDRDRLRDESAKVKREHDWTKSLMERNKRVLNKDATLPCTVEGLKETLERYREALVTFQVEKSLMESKLQSEINFLKETIQAEQVAKEQLEDSLSSDLEEAKREITKLQSTNQRMLKDVMEKQDLQNQIEKDQLSIASIRSKSKEIIQGLREKLMSEVSTKEQLEGELSVTKNQVRSLQESLETSEQVQRDFVRLSQSLQMKLEEVRQKEEEKSEKPSEVDTDPSGTSFHISSKPTDTLR
nr:rab GTPase-binding effector protein 1 isoform X1 [Ciona intestinalis]|eukprot:XP_018669591.1 rab GTPase-binding effector protein 1 isoform X1 [Ciona intestinalis]